MSDDFVPEPPFWSPELIRAFDSFPSCYGAVIANQTFHIRIANVHLLLHLPDWPRRWRCHRVRPHRMNITNVTLTAMQFHARHVGRMIFSWQFEVLSMSRRRDDNTVHMVVRVRKRIRAKCRVNIDTSLPVMKALSAKRSNYK